jgi:SSS family solute:Na+ symporter
VPLAPIDVAVVCSYLAGILGLSFAIARRQRTGGDYFLAGRRMGRLPLALSIVANQVSAVSLVGAPAFVALREGGGLRWLQYELALPLAMLLLVAGLLPALRSVAGSSIYAYAEGRFGPATRRALAGAFLLSRGLSLGVILYAASLVVAEATALPPATALVALGLVSVLYTGLGGIVADIWSDVVQLILLWGSSFVCAAYVLVHAGPAVLRAIPADRSEALVLGATGIGDGATFAFWPMLLGGLFLYVSYYGCDQSQAQRLLTARDDRAARDALVLNGLLRFPLVLTYCGLGLLLAGLLQVDASFAELMRERPADSLVPAFMVSYLPPGLRGLLLAAILAAAMSSIDSALNSLAAVTLEDVLGHPAERQSVWLGRATSLGWGIFAVVSGLLFARAEKGVLELVNQVGSAFYGPVLAVFALGALAPRVGQRAALAGLASGLLVNASLARFAPSVSWLWWNPAGFLTAAAAALAATGLPVALRAPGLPRREAALLGAGFALILAVLLALPRG